jgi:hypothetical protein
MKLFFVTYRDCNENFCRAVIGQMGTHYAIARINAGVQHGIFTEGMFKTSRYSRNYEVRSRAIVGARSIEEALDVIDTVHDVHISPMTTYQRNIIKTVGRVMFKDMLNAFYMATSNNRASVIYSRLVNLFYNTDNMPEYFQWHCTTIYPQHFVQARNLYRDLGKLVAQAVHDGDTSPVEEFIMDDCKDVAGVDQVSLFQNIKLNSSLELSITECDCGHLEYDSETHSVGQGHRADTWCDLCFQEDAVYVENRDEYWARDDAYHHESDGCYYSYEEDEYDEDDDDSQDSDLLMSYSTNVLNYLTKDSRIQSSPHGDFLMGIEFEMETKEGCSVNAAVSDVRSQLGEHYCVCKSDGSLGSYGLEIVTAPRGLAEHIKNFKRWEIDSSYRAWDTKRCGLHVHIDSHAFTQMTLGKFLMLINSETNVDFIRKIAGRHPHTDEQARSYCASEYQEVLVNPSKAVKGKSHERYRMVNLQNLGVKESKRLTSTTAYDGKYDTVELRIFRASLNKPRMLAQIEFTHACVNFCRVASWRDLNQISFVKWLKTVSSSYPNLADWYGVRRRNTKVTAESQCRDTVESV